MRATLVLEDGSSFEGISIGTPGEKIGKAVLNTAVVGYQEMMTDPANAGKILILTYPLIGNYGVAKKFNESNKSRLVGLVIKEASRIHSNWQAEGSFQDFIKDEGIITVSDVDTRTLTVTIRDKGEMLGIISTKDSKKEELLKRLKAYKGKETVSYIKEISVKNEINIKQGNAGHRIAILDLGITNSFIKQLKTLGCNITILPYNTPSESILNGRFDGLIISNGPEEDAAIPEVSGTIKDILGKIPILGISTGHLIIGLALGAKLTKMKIGHHGVNYPVKGPDSYKGDITVQNHSLVIDEGSLKKMADITLRNINDNSIEEMESRALKFISIQYYPASPGFDEVNEVFRRFLKMIPRAKGVKQKQASSSRKEAQYAKA